MMERPWEVAIEEDPDTRIRRRIQQRRCIVCGGQQLASPVSYFCTLHLETHRYCSMCSTMYLAREYGTDTRCRSCSSARARAHYRQNPERTYYRIRLRQLAERRQSRIEQIFSRLQQRIALAKLVAETPGWSWVQRATQLGGGVNQAKYLSLAYRQQLMGTIHDPDYADRVRKEQARGR